MENKIKILVIGIIIVAITFGAIIVGIILGGFSLYNLAEQKESGVGISYVGITYDVVCTQGAAENLTGMESVKVHGMFWNTGNKEAKNVTVTLIFTDTAHDKVVRQTVVKGVDLLPDGASSAGFDAGYLREMIIPKTLVNETMQVNWMEDGQLKTFTTQLAAGMNKAKL